MRRYSHIERDAVTIAFEVIVRGSSDGWSGNIAAFNALKVKLAPFNIEYKYDSAGTWAKAEPAAPDRDYEQRGMKVIMRWEGAKQPATMPQAVIFYEQSGEFIVSYEYRESNGNWTCSSGKYFNPRSYGGDKSRAYDLAAKEYSQRVEDRSEWYKASYFAFERIEQFIK